MILIIIGIIILIYICSGFYIIKQNQKGILLRFGKLIQKNIGPGLHYALPFPVDRIIKIPVKTIKKIKIDDFGFGAEESDNSEDEDENEDSYEYEEDVSKLFSGIKRPYLFTGDKNIVHLKLLIQYTIKEPENYLFANLKPDDILRKLISGVVTWKFLSQYIDKVFTTEKIQIQGDLKDELQNRCNEIKLGINIISIEMRDVIPPYSVQASFNDVINAKIERNTQKHEAESYKNKILSKANAEAQELIQEALSYEKEKIEKSEGEAIKFINILKEYNKSPSVTRIRFFYEFWEEMAGELDNIIFVDKSKGKPVQLRIRIEDPATDK